MKAADAAGLMAARAGDVVEPALKARRPNGCFAWSCRARRPSSGPRRRRVSLNTGSPPASSPCTRPKSGCSSEAANPPASIAIAPLARNFSGIRIVPRSSSLKCLGSSSHALNVAPEICHPPRSARDRSGFPAALVEGLLSARCSQTPSADSRCGNPASPISAHARSGDWSRCERCFQARSGRAGRLSRSVFRKLRAGQR